MLKHRQISLTLDVLKAVFIFLLVYAAAGKLLDFKTFTNSLRQAPLLKNTPSVVAISLPLLELFVTSLLLLPSALKFGLYAFFSLITLFTLYIIYILLSGQSIPCTCGGLIENMSWQQHIVFNGLFMALSAAAIRVHHMQKQTNYRQKLIAQ